MLVEVGQRFVAAELLQAVLALILGVRSMRGRTRIRGCGAGQRLLSASAGDEGRLAAGQLPAEDALLRGAQFCANATAASSSSAAADERCGCRCRVAAALMLVVMLLVVVMTFKGCAVRRPQMLPKSLRIFVRFAASIHPAAELLLIHSAANNILLLLGLKAANIFWGCAL